MSIKNSMEDSMKFHSMEYIAEKTSFEFNCAELADLGAY
jgi:hypothetical protein